MIKKFLKPSLLNRLRIFRPAITCFSFSNQDPKYSDEIMQQLKTQAQQFYENIVVEKQQQAIDVKDANHFNSIVAQSDKRLVIVYCYAQWSPETKEFKEKLYNNMKPYEDVSTILNVDIDKHANLITQLQINSVPFAGLVFNNQFVDGYFKNKKTDQFMSVVDQLARILRGEDASEILLQQMTELYEKNHSEELIKLTSEALKRDVVKKEHPKYLLFQALAYILKEDIHKVKEIIEQFDKSYKEDLEDLNTKQLYEIVQIKNEELQKLQSLTPEMRRIIDRLQTNPDDKDLKFDLAEESISHKNYEVAIKSLLEIVKSDKNWADKKAQKKLIELFALLGNSNALVIEGRKQLGKLLY